MRRFLMAVALVSMSAGCNRRSHQPAWRWSLDSVKQVATTIRAGRSLKPPSWPGGARVAVLLSFDVDNQTIALAGGKPTINALSQGEYGARVGLRRVLEQLDRYGLPATFFVPALSLLLSPEMVGLIQRSKGRHEFGVHGWIHESSPPAREERELIRLAVDTLTHLTGVRPVGYRAPVWNPSSATIATIRDLGFVYESSLMADDDPYELVSGGKPTGLVELPVSWILDDLPQLDPRGDHSTAPRDVLQAWIDEFDRAYAEGGMFLLTLHPQVIGRRSRIVLLEQLLDHIHGKPGVWFATHRAAAEYLKQSAER